MNLGATGDTLKAALARGGTKVDVEVDMDTLWNLLVFQLEKLTTRFANTIAMLTRLYSRDGTMVEWVVR